MNKLTIKFSDQFFCQDFSFSPQLKELNFIYFNTGYLKEEKLKEVLANYKQLVKLSVEGDVFQNKMYEIFLRCFIQNNKTILSLSLLDFKIYDKNIIYETLETIPILQELLEARGVVELQYMGPAEEASVRVRQSYRPPAVAESGLASKGTRLVCLELTEVYELKGPVGKRRPRKTGKQIIVGETVVARGAPENIHGFHFFAGTNIRYMQCLREAI